jgi:hypothetical protein
MHMQRNLTRILAFALLALLLNACEIETDVLLKDGDTRVVLEMWLNDQPGPQTLRLTRTTAFTGDPRPDYVSGAVAVLTDDTGQADTLEEVRPGFYQTGHFVGRQEHAYKLSVTVEGKTYTAENQMRRINPILFSFSQYSDTLIFGPGYYCGLVAQEPAGLGDYYLFRIYKNDSLYDGPSNLLLTDDKFVDGQLSPFLYPYPFELGDTVIMEVRGLSNLSYDYYLTLSQQTNSSGGPFGSPPENVLTNVTNNGLGFFGCAAVQRDTLIIVQ